MVAASGPGRSALVLLVIIMLIAYAASVPPVTAHQISKTESGTDTSSVESVESCAVFQWTQQGRCETYDTMNHEWEVTNNCSRGIYIRWADNAYGKPIRYGEESGKPKSEKRTTLNPGEVEKREVSCVDKAELEYCIDYRYPTLQEHDCKDFFD